MNFEPRIGEPGHVSDVLAVLLGVREELTIRLPALALDALHKLHRGDGAAGVPLGAHEGVAVLVQFDVCGDRDVIPLAETFPEDWTEGRRSKIEIGE